MHTCVHTIAHTRAYTNTHTHAYAHLNIPPRLLAMDNDGQFEGATFISIPVDRMAPGVVSVYIANLIIDSRTPKVKPADPAQPANSA